ncbi:MAG: BadF/BadG/BcrA/BcrD ATPase family protein [Clostridia bacterium]
MAAAMTGADVMKNEITAHGVAALQASPKVQTILEIGGQDSKIILIRDGIIYDFAMNTVCAAGTGSFFDRQAQRLNIPIQELGHYALRSSHPARIAGRCAVFAESDMIHKQQEGQPLEDILSGLCPCAGSELFSESGKRKADTRSCPFQGGVAQMKELSKRLKKN